MVRNYKKKTNRCVREWSSFAPFSTSYKLQPLDVGVFAPFKSYLKKSLTNFMINHTGQIYRSTHNGPFLEAFTPRNIASDLVPHNLTVFIDFDLIDNKLDTSLNNPLPIVTSADVEKLPLAGPSNVESVVDIKPTLMIDQRLTTEKKLHKKGKKGGNKGSK
ncbi:hypothetical protein JTB14_013043 [Gonioctena quinquepunctata]|nr:hypothetical protein JTB14_013043 [Gonioctena quinquepunctata]